MSDSKSEAAKPADGASPHVEADVPKNKSGAEEASLQVTDTQRNGSITGIGIVLGFSLTFTGQWSLGSGKWHVAQAVAMGVALTGIILQISALLGGLDLPPSSVKLHSGTIRKFKCGVILVLLAFVIHVLADLAIDVLNWNVP